MAEYLLRHRLGRNSAWRVMSAGTAAIDGMPASRNAVEVMREKGIDAGSHVSRAMTRALADSADVIVAMTAAHKDDILHTFPDTKRKVFLLKALGTRPVPDDVDDPVGLTTDAYRRVRDEIDAVLPDVVLFLHEHVGPRRQV